MSWGIRLRLAWAAVVAIIIGAVLTVAVPAEAATQATIFGAQTPSVVSDPDTSSVELGLQFKSAVAGNVTGIRFYKGPSNGGAHTGSLWSGSTRLATTTFSGETASGWQQTSFATPVSIGAGQVYTASYLAPRGHYSVNDTFGFPKTAGSLTALKGVYRYGGGYPTSTYQTSNYWVDIQFVAGTTVPTSSSTPTSTTMATTTASPTTSTSAATSTTATPTGLTLREIDGGTAYYGKFARPLPDRATFFPIAVWFESVRSTADTAVDKDAGLNTYIALTNDSRGDLIKAAGMYAFPENPIANQGTEVAGWLTGDEVDMSGTGWWQAPTQAQFDTLTRQVDAVPKDGTARFTNFGKGIVFGGAEEDAAAARMVSNYQDIVSADVYWFTDRDVASVNQGGNLLGLGRDLTTTEMRAPSNYGVVVQKIRRLLDYKKPVWGFTEVGGPFPYNTTAASYATPAQVRASVWSQIINGARGIIYFNHSFGGPAQTQHALRDPFYGPVRAVVKSTNEQITRLAPVLNAPTIDNLVSTTGRVSVLSKKLGSDIYLLVGSTQSASQSVTISLRCGAIASAQVIDESRALPMVANHFTDTFNDNNAVHIYKVVGAATACGL